MSEQICVECGNDDATEGHDMCLDCLEGLTAPEEVEGS